MNKYFFSTRSIGAVKKIIIMAFIYLAPMQVFSADTCVVGNPLTGGTQHCSANASGSMGNGYTWTIWSERSGGCITTYDNQGCAFKATWNNNGNYLARAGLRWNSTKTHDQIGNITAEFALTKSGSGGGWSYIGIYGWSRNPLVEYYIIDDWFNKPNPGSRIATITVDGASYTVYKATRVNAPSIDGNQTFDQFFSVRQTNRQCGRISISEHFKKWDSLGLRLGKMYEAMILAETAGGSGTIDFTKASVVVGSTNVVNKVPEVAKKQGGVYLRNVKDKGLLSVVSLNGTIIRSVHQSGSDQAIVPITDMAPGVYLLKFCGENKAKATQSIFVR